MHLELFHDIISSLSKGCQASAACQLVVAQQRVTNIIWGTYGWSSKSQMVITEWKISCLIEVLPIIREIIEEKHC